MIKSIFYEQDQDYLNTRYAKALSKENLEFELNYLVSEISVGEIYEFYIVNDKDEIVDNLNLYVEEIVQIYVDDNFDYIIKGTNEEDEGISIGLSNTEFWTS